MTMVMALAEETRAAGAENDSQLLIADRSDARSSIPSEVLERSKVQLRNQQGAAVQRGALLGVLLARLDSVPFDSIAKMLGVKEVRLVKMMHGEESIPGSFEKRWTLIAECLDDLHSVLRPKATWRWFNLPIPDLENQTPFDVVVRSRGPEIIRALARGYSDESFS